MVMSRSIVTCVLWLVIGIMAVPVSAMDGSQKKEFDRILNLAMPDLTKEAQKRLEKKYPKEDWGSHKFPDYVFTNPSAETGYMIAVKESDLLKKVTCYCFCDRMGHRNLLYCFFKDGKAGAEFDRHASLCNICYGEAMMTFLWAEIGASIAEIGQGIEKRWKPKT